PPVIGSTAATAYVLTSAADRITRTFYDRAGWPTYRVDAEGYVVKHQYDALGNDLQTTRYAEIYSVIDTDTPASLATKLPATPPATAVQESRTYDHAGRLVDAIDALGNVTRTLYDALGQVTDQIRAYGTVAAST